MKFTNIKQLIIKFMGGGIINFPTRFLRWVKIEGDTDGSDDGGGDEPTPEPQPLNFLSNFPFPSKLIGVVDNTNWEGVYGPTDYDTYEMQLLKPIIPIDNLLDYIRENHNNETKQFQAIFEWKEGLTGTNPTSPIIYYGIRHFFINYYADDSGETLTLSQVEIAQAMGFATVDNIKYLVPITFGE